MSLIDRAATFRGKIVDHGVSKSKNGYPQWVVQLEAVEIYDGEEKIWVDWSAYDVNEITAFLTLVGSTGETLTCQQLRKIIKGWDGISFLNLGTLDLPETNIQFRVEENTYQGKTSLQVKWVDEYDAEPGRTVRKLNPEDLKVLDAQYAKFLKQSAIPVKPKKVTAKGIKPTQPKGPVTKKSNDPLGPPASIPDNTPPVPVDPNLPVGKCTKDEAWETVNSLKAKDIDDGKIADIWLGALNEVAPGVGQGDVTEEQWFKVKEIVLAKTAIF